jgi:hypothetical protein
MLAQHAPNHLVKRLSAMTERDLFCLFHAGN